MSPDLLRQLRELSRAPADATRTPTPRAPRQVAPPAPVMRDRMANALPIAPAPTPAQQLAQLVAEMAPGSGEGIGLRRATDDAMDGRFGEAVGELGLTLAGVLPVGDAAKGLKGLLKGSDRVIDVDGVLRPVLNSRGKAIHPTEEGVRNFWRWFGDGKVVDDAGRPRVVYHGTGRNAETPEEVNFNQFRRNEMDHGYGWFAENRKHADIYDQGRMIDAYLNFANPVVVPNRYGKTIDGWMDALRKSGVDTSNMSAKPWDGFGGDGDELAFWELLENNYGRNNILDELKRQGFDGLVTPSEQGIRGRNFLAVSPNSIKSATGNSGAFSPTDPRITAALLAAVGLGGAAGRQDRPARGGDRE